jgi:O-antigen/teichoic acid export membrane protein
MSETEGNSWLWRQRSSTRLGFLLNVASRIFGGIAGLVWTRLLLDAMGKPLWGLFSAFQSVAALGGLGDLGLGGAVGIETGRCLGRGANDELRQFLAAARALFLMLAVAMGGAFAIMSAWLPQWLGFVEEPAAGSLTKLFLIGSVAVAVVVLTSYISNVNYGCGNVVWPILPGFVLTQLTLLAHWLLAREHASLWLQFIPYMVSLAIALVFTWTYVRLSHGAIAELKPIRFDWQIVRRLLETSFWVYVTSLGSVIYTTTDRLIVNAGFGPAELPRFQLNNRLCELVYALVIAAGYSAMPKITQWMASPAADTRARAIAEMIRLSQFQTFFGCAAALTYLFINDLFIQVWIGADLIAPIFWQAAFAANLAMTASMDIALQVTLRTSDRGVREAGLLIAITAALNVALSLIAMKMGSIGGIALATTLAQTILGLCVSRKICTRFNLSWWPWAMRTSLLPLIVVAAGAALHAKTPLNSWTHAALAMGGYGATLAVISFGTGVTPAFVREELGRLRAIIRF